MGRRKKKIMIVEDDSIVAESLVYLLEKFNYRPVGPYSTAAEAIVKARKEKPDLILMDVNLKGKMEGVQAAEQIHRELDIPIIFTTAYASDRILKKAKKSFPYGYILKPFSEYELKSNIEMALFKYQQELQTRKIEQKWQQLFNSIRELILITDAEGNIIELNPFGQDILGLGQKEFRKVNLPRDLYEYPPHWEEQLQQLKEKGAFSGFSQRLRKKEGELIDVVAAGNILQGKKGEIAQIIFIFTDVTRIKQLEKGLFQAQKMESLGNLASGIAHDFNNVLSAILGYAQMGALAAEDRVLKKYFANIEKAANRAANLTRQILAFARKQEISYQPIDINRFLQENYDLYRRLIPENIELSLNLCEEPLTIRSDQSSLEQIILNLVVNARDAITGSGRITITTEKSLLVKEELMKKSKPNLEPGEYVIMQIHDTGVGIPEEIKEKIFEPFFTTKPEGQGTGLGLSVVLGLVEQLGGFIELDSTPDEGTEFRIFLPYAKLEEKAKKEKSSFTLPRGSGTILVVEDESDILRMTEWMLSTLGYNVITANNGKEALEKIIESRGKIDLLLSDVVMPELTGPELVKEIQNHQLQIPVVFMTGYGSRLEESHQTILNTAILLRKPFTLKQLGEVVARNIRKVE